MTWGSATSSAVRMTRNGLIAMTARVSCSGSRVADRGHLARPEDGCMSRPRDLFEYLRPAQVAAR